jgi:hypothetical protein
VANASLRISARALGCLRYHFYELFYLDCALFDNAEALGSAWFIHSALKDRPSRLLLFPPLFPLLLRQSLLLCSLFPISFLLLLF